MLQLMVLNHLWYSNFVRCCKHIRNNMQTVVYWTCEDEIQSRLITSGYELIMKDVNCLTDNAKNNNA